VVSAAVPSVVGSVVGLLQPRARAKIPKPIKMLFLMVRIVNSMLSIKTKNSAAEYWEQIANLGPRLASKRLF
jgi:hypothetical protein